MRSTRLNPLQVRLNGRRPYGTQQGAEWQGIFSLQPYFSGWVGESFPLISSSLQLLLLILVKLQFKIAIPIEHQLDRVGVDFVLFSLQLTSK